MLLLLGERCRCPPGVAHLMECVVLHLGPGNMLLNVQQIESWSVNWCSSWCWYCYLVCLTELLWWSLSKKERKNKCSGEPLASIAEAAWCFSWSPFYISFLYFSPIGLPDAFKPTERDNRNSGFSFPPSSSEGLYMLLRPLILSPKSGKFRLSWNIIQGSDTHWHFCGLMRN